MGKESFRKARKIGYTTIQNNLLDDDKVKLEGKGLIAILLSNSNDWEIKMPDIISRSKNGRDTHYDVIWHLIEQGYYARVYVKDKGRHKELVHIFSDVKEDVRMELGEVVASIEKEGFACVVEYLIPKPPKQKRGSRVTEDVPVSQPRKDEPVKKPVTENQYVEEEESQKPVTDFQDTVFSDTESPNTDSQYINKPNREEPNSNKTNIQNPNPNLNLEVNVIDTLWETSLPMKLKRWIKVKIADKTLTINNEQILLIEEAYEYQKSKGYIISDCSDEYTGAINDNEFSGSIAKMLDTVKDIRNMKGSVQTWIKNAHDFKVGNLMKPVHDRKVGFYDWLNIRE